MKLNPDILEAIRRAVDHYGNTSQFAKEIGVAHSTVLFSGLPFPSPGDLPKPGIKPRSPALQAESLPAEPPGKPIKMRKFPSIPNLLSVFFMKGC